MVILLTVAGLGEGLSIVTLLPVIETALGLGDDPSPVSLLVIRTLEGVGIGASVHDPKLVASATYGWHRPGVRK